MIQTRINFFAILFCLLAGSSLLRSQTISYPEIGIQAQKTYINSDIDTIYPLNGNVNVHIPLITFPQIGGLELSVFLRSNGGSWHWGSASDDFGDFAAFYTNQLPMVGSPNQLLIEGGLPPLDVATSLDVSGLNTTYDVLDTINLNANCPTDGSDCFIPVEFSGFITDPTGARHPLAYEKYEGSLRASDGGGFRMGGNLLVDYPHGPPSRAAALITDANGNTYGLDASGDNYTIADSNGNTIRRSANYDTVITDTVGRKIPEIASTQQMTSVIGCPILNIPGQPLAGSFQWNVPGPNGSTQTYLFCVANVEFATNFFGSDGCKNYPNQDPNRLETCGPRSGIQSVVLPNGTSWKFAYDAVTPTNPYGYGDLISITNPTGGTIRYSYANVTPGINCITARTLVSRTTDDGRGGTGTWKYLTGQQAKITDPYGNDTTYTYYAGNECSYYESDRKYYQGNAETGTILKEISTANYSVNDPIMNGQSDNVLPHVVTTSTSAGSFVETDGYDIQSTNQELQAHYDITSNTLYADPDGGLNTVAILYNLPTSSIVNNYDGTTLISKSLTRLAPAGPQALLNGALSPYYKKNLLNLVSKTDTNDPSSSYESTAAFDEVNLGPTCICGNQTSRSLVDKSGVRATSRWTTAYNPNGTALSTADANSNTSSYPGTIEQFAYDTSGVFINQSTKSSTNGVAHVTKQTTDDNTGRIESRTDENDKSTKYLYYPLGGPNATRLQEVDLPNGAVVNLSYIDRPGATTVTERMTINQADGTRMSNTTEIDGFGRVVRETRATATCQTGHLTVNTEYDQLGRVSSKTNAYCLSTDSTFGKKTYHYDALGRKVIAINADGSIVQWCYDGQKVDTLQANCESNQSASVGDWEDVTDESGTHYQYIYDALGRLITVIEPSPGGTIPKSTTTYKYDVRKNLSLVSQTTSSATVTRTFTYDGFGQLLTSFNPESGTISYLANNCGQVGLVGPIGPAPPPPCNAGLSAYDPNGNVLRKVDARGVATSFIYDSLNRIIAKVFAGTNGASSAIAALTPASCFQYDVPATGSSGANAVGRLTAEWTILGGCTVQAPANGYQTKKSILSYSPTGQVLSESQCTPVNCGGQNYQLAYAYDFANNLIQYTNGVQSIIISQRYDELNRLQSVLSSVETPTNPPSLYNIITSGPDGWTKAAFGNSIVVDRAFDVRGRILNQNVLTFP